MKNTTKIFISISILVILLSIPAISAEDNATILKSTDDSSSQNEYTITADDFTRNDMIQLNQNFKYTITQKDIDTAKNSSKGWITKKLPDVKVKVFEPVKVTVKEKIYKTVKVKITKKFTCWHANKKTIKMDANYLQNYYKYQAEGYNIDSGKWIKTGNSWKCVFTATKYNKVKKWTGKYKTTKITQYKAKMLKGIKMYIFDDGYVSIEPDVKGYRSGLYITGNYIPELNPWE